MTNWQSMPLQCAAFRVTRLAADGTTPADVGAGSSYVSNKLMKIEFNPEVEAGPEVSNRGASGDLIQVFKMDDQIKRYTISIQIGTVDPELEWILTGGTILTSNGTPLSTPATPSSSTAGTGGTMSAGTYGYKVTAFSSYGQTPGSAEKTQVVASGTTNTVTLTWATVSGAVSYGVYGRTSGGPWQFIAKVPQSGSPTWTDLGTITPNAAVVAPTIDTSGTAVNGYAYPTVGPNPNPNGICLEAWSRNIAQPGTPGYGAGQQIAEAPYIRWVFPMIRGLRKANRAIDANPVDSTFEGGYAIENTQLGNGPFNDWLYDSSRAVQWAYEDSSHIPTVQIGRVSVPTQV